MPRSKPSMNFQIRPTTTGEMNTGMMKGSRKNRTAGCGVVRSSARKKPSASWIVTLAAM